MKRLLISVLFFKLFFFSLSAQSLDCDFAKNSRLEIRLGTSEKFIPDPIIPEYNTLPGFSPSVHLTLPIKLREGKYIFTKLIFGGSINDVEFNENVNGVYIGGLTTTLYDNIYVGLGLGYAFDLEFKNGSSLRFPFSINAVYHPFVEIIKDPGLQPVLSRDYLIDIQSNYDEEFNLSIVPEIAGEYHFANKQCRSFSIGIYYSRGFNTTYEGKLRLERANGERFEQSFKKPFNTFGVSFGYGIFRAKN